MGPPGLFRIQDNSLFIFILCVIIHSMKNTKMTGYVYHVMDKMNGEVVKVGSTTRPVEERWKEYNKTRYFNHFILEVRVLESSELDWYEPGNSDSPFLWHLIAIEHIEMLKQGTFRKGNLSNKISPLVQKSVGFDGLKMASIGGKIAGKLSVENKTGIHSPSFDRKANGYLGGIKNVESGHLQRISSAGGKASGAIQGRKNAESGRMREVQKMGLGLGGKIGGPKGMHTRWHVRRGIVSPTCKLCNPSA